MTPADSSSEDLDPDQRERLRVDKEEGKIQLPHVWIISLRRK